jgi:hypothetical protein
MTDANDVETRKGNIVIGATLILTGVAIVLDRAGVLQWRDQWTLWPIILGGIGLARFLQSPPGEPKQGLLFLTAAVWLFLAEAGVTSLADSWPMAIIALGLMVALNGGTRRRRWPVPDHAGGPLDAAHFKRMRRHDRSMSALGVLGVWIAVVVALQVSGLRSFDDNTSTDQRVRIVSVMGRSEHTSRATAFEGADITNVMGRSELNLLDATLAPGANASVHVFSAMGPVILRVPPTWTIDAGAVSAFGGIRDDRIRPAESDTSTGPAPRVVLRGAVLFGRLLITS